MKQKLLSGLGCVLLVVGPAACSLENSDTGAQHARTTEAMPQAFVGSVADGSGGPAPAGGMPSQFLALSDVHFGVKAYDSCFKQYDCETSSTLWKSAISEATKMASDPKVGFIIYTGDLPAHNEDPSDRESEFSTVLGGLAAIAGASGKRLIYLPGNNDTIGGDYCSFTFGNETVFDFAPVKSNWPAFGGKNDIIDGSRLQSGYYSIYPMGKPPAGSSESQLRVIALNTVMFTQHYFDWCTGTMTEAEQQKRAKAQIDWLAGQLKAARTARTDSGGNPVSDKVMIAMHVPPGTDGFGGRSGKRYVTEWRDDLDYAPGMWLQQKFLTIVSDNKDIITGLLSAHTHLNGIRRIKNCSGDFVELDMSVPAVTSDHGSNPALRLVTFNDEYEWIDASTRYATQSSKNDPGRAGQKLFAYDWSQSFSFATNYSCTSCDGSETLQQRIAKIDDATLLSDLLQYLKVAPGSSRQRMYQYALDTRCSAARPATGAGH